MPEEAPIEEQLSSVSISSSVPATKAPLTSLQDLEPPRRSVAASSSISPSATPSLPSDAATTNLTSTSTLNTANYAHPSPSNTTTPSHRSHSPANNLKRSDPFQFGSRYLEAGDDVFEWNAWDHVDPSKDELFVAYAQHQFEFQREHRLSDFDRSRFNREPEKWWDKFYGNNKEKFFKDRKWLKQEFPILGRCCAGVAEGDGEVEGERERKEENGEREEVDGRDADGSEVRAEDRPAVTNTDCSIQENSSLSSQPAPTSNLRGPARPGGDWLPPPSSSTATTSEPFNTILEIGAGAGNTAFPILAQNLNPHLLIHATDFSKKAIDLIRINPAYDPTHIRAEVWDMASATQTLPAGVEPGSIDVVMLVFAFSALNPRQWAQAVRNVYTALRPGGEVCFRDYGRGDLAQVRFKKGRLLEENFYIRGDGTRVYFFEEEELRKIWGGRMAEVLPEFEVRGGGGGAAIVEGADSTGAGGVADAGAKGDGKNGVDVVGRDAAIPTIYGSNDSTGMKEPVSNKNDIDKKGNGEQASAAETEITAEAEAAKAKEEEEQQATREEAKMIIQDAKSTPSFDILALAADRRLLVNRSSRLKMYRCWMQGRFRKPF